MNYCNTWYPCQYHLTTFCNVTSATDQQSAGSLDCSLYWLSVIPNSLKRTRLYKLLRIFWALLYVLWLASLLSHHLLSDLCSSRKDGNKPSQVNLISWSWFLQVAGLHNRLSLCLMNTSSDGGWEASNGLFLTQSLQP